jgi:hypothetical protein
MRILPAAIATALFGLAPASPVLAAPGEPLGAEQLLLPATGTQSALPVVGVTPDGRHAVAFLAAGSATNGLLAELSHGPYWQPPVAAPLRWMVDPHPSIVSPAMSVSSYGYPLLAWERRNTSYLSEGVYLAYFDALGRPVGGSLRVDQQPPRQTHVIRTASNGHGTRHVVLWGAERGGSVDARARWYDNTLQPLGDELRVDVGGLDVFPHIDVAMLAGVSAQAVVAYVGLASSNPTFHDTLYLRRLSDTGELGAPVALAAGDASGGWIYHAEQPSLAATGDGGLLVVWRAVGRLPGTSQRRVQLRAQRLDNTLAPLGDVQALTPAYEHVDALISPDVAAAAAGGFALAWVERAAAGTAPAVRLLHLDATATPLAAPQTVAQGAVNLIQPQVAIDAYGDTVVAWTALAADNTAQALSRRYRGAGAVDLGLSDSGALALAPGESASLSLAVHNHSPAGGNPADFGRDYASGIRLQIDVDPAITLGFSSGQGWTCSGAAPLSCRLNAILATGSAAPPLELYVNAGAHPGSFPIAIHATGDQDDPVSSNNTAAFAVHVLDLLPEAFSFPPVNGVARGSSVVSAPAVLTGFDGPLVATVSGGELSVNGSPFGSVPVEVVAGASLRLRHQASTDFAGVRITRVEVGGVVAEFRSETEAADTTPDAFTIASLAGVARNTVVESAAVSLTGINAPAAITVSNGSYSIDGAAYTSAPGQLGPGQQVRVRHTSATNFGTTVSSTLTIGGVSGTFTSTTEAEDTIPAAFDFVDVVDARRRSTVTSNVITVSGINAPASLSISGGGASYAVNDGAFANTPRTVVAGDRIQLRLTTPNTANSVTSTTLNIGGVTDVWRVTTGRK